ncbi:hypothetical protein GGTG_12389 [Gaeumannomyces tritici R3-111a-1]|uniref:Uncharacterized protein n=1 Tax=Gaeumannomyces tritici (strain R3-111a-1) TaxID=644352 RepID=J3PFW4_GAET3|nr:hypothetical protein GGTG_12389 [Gaeumannomyces tritici R3-111a-1]EJT70216.1 hypothetical protein GGTG_12389 [Gaeumannomyces tritici R3-111a-1]
MVAGLQYLPATGASTVNEKVAFFVNLSFYYNVKSDVSKAGVLKSLISVNLTAGKRKTLFLTKRFGKLIVNKSKRFGICTAFLTSISILTPTLTSVCKVIGKKAASKRDKAENNNANVPKKEGEFVIQSACIALEANGVTLFLNFCVKLFALTAKALFLNKITVYGPTKIAHPFKFMVVNALLLKVICKKKLGIF